VTVVGVLEENFNFWKVWPPNHTHLNQVWGTILLKYTIWTWAKA